MRTGGMIASILFCGLGAAMAGNEAKRDIDRMQGAWQVVTLVERGKKIPDAETKSLTIVVTGDRLVIEEDGKVVTAYKVKLDEKQKPRAMDMTITEGEQKDQIAPGIYAIDGDTMVMCVDEGVKNRPASFDEKDTKTCSVIRLKRKKKD